MKKMTLTEFNQNSSRAIAYVDRGETVQVTRRGLPCAELVPPRSLPADPIEAIFASGMAKRPTGTIDFAHFESKAPVILPSEYANLNDLLDEVNGDRGF